MCAVVPTITIATKAEYRHYISNWFVTGLYAIGLCLDCLNKGGVFVLNCIYERWILSVMHLNVLTNRVTPWSVLLRCRADERQVKKLFPLILGEVAWLATLENKTSFSGKKRERLFSESFVNDLKLFNNTWSFANNTQIYCPHKPPRLAWDYINKITIKILMN